MTSQSSVMKDTLDLHEADAPLCEYLAAIAI